jgi:hypothetical protein
MRFSKWPYLASCILLSGCATTHAVVTNAYLKTDASAKLPIAQSSTFTVQGNTDAPNPLFDEEVRKKIECILVQKGYRLASGTDSDFTVRYNYDVSARTETTSQSQWTTVPTVQTYYVKGSAYSSILQSQAYATYIPETHTIYLSRLFVKVYQTASSGPSAEQVVWVGDTFYENDDPDLRTVIDYLIVATFAYFNQNTGKNVTVALPEKSPDVLFLRQQETKKS